MIQLTYTLETPEIIRLTRRKQLGWLRRLYWVAGVVFILLIVTGAIIGKWEGLVIFGLLMALSIGMYEWRWPKLMDKMLRKSSAWGKPITYTFEEARITQTSVLSETVMQWETFKKAEELPDWFLLHIGPMTYVSLPKRAFASEAQMMAFRDLLKTKGLLLNNQ